MSDFTDQNRTPIVKQLNGLVDGVGAGKTAVIKIPPGSTYTDIILECRIAGVAATRAQLETMLLNMRLTVGGVEKWSLTAKQIIAIVEFYNSGTIGDTGYLCIPFERLWQEGLSGKLNPAYGTLGETSFQLEVIQDGASTIDSIKAWARISPVAEELGAHIKIVRLTPSISGLGTYTYADLPKRPGDYLFALHLQVPVVANLTAFRYIADEVRILDTTPDVMARLYSLPSPVRTPQGAKGFVHIDFACRNIDTDAVALNMNSQILELDFANVAPGQINILAEIGTVQAPRVSKPA